MVDVLGEVVWSIKYTSFFLSSTRLHGYEKGRTPKNHIRKRRKDSRALIPIHSHPLALPTQLPIRRRTDWPAAPLRVRRTALFQRQQLLGTETLVVDLRRRLDQVLQVRARQEVPEVDELAVALVFDVDGAPAVLPAADGFAGHIDVALGADDGEGNDGLEDLR